MPSTSEPLGLSSPLTNTTAGTSLFFPCLQNDSTDLTVAPRSLHWSHTGMRVSSTSTPASLSSLLSLPLLDLKYIKKELFVLFPIHRAISYQDASFELCPPCLPNLSFPRLIPMESLQVDLPVGDPRLS